MQKKNKKGFTIVELVVVIAVIGILSAILIPTFMGLSENARAKALQSDLSSIYTQYAVEAADGVVDGVYIGRETSSTVHSLPENGSVREAQIAILAQDKVVIDYKGEYYAIKDSSKNEWEKVAAPDLTKTVVEKLGEHQDAVTGDSPQDEIQAERFYTLEDKVYTVVMAGTKCATAADLSTFVGGTVYAKN